MAVSILLNSFKIDVWGPSKRTFKLRKCNSQDRDEFGCSENEIRRPKRWGGGGGGAPPPSENEKIRTEWFDSNYPKRIHYTNCKKN